LLTEGQSPLAGSPFEMGAFIKAMEVNSSVRQMALFPTSFFTKAATAPVGGVALQRQNAVLCHVNCVYDYPSADVT
jgi:hypothetical protein